MNLLLNAYQSIDGEGEIEVRTRSDESHVLVDITDTGRGIPADKLQRIFDPSSPSRSPE